MKQCANPDGDALKGTSLECRKIAVTHRVVKHWNIKKGTFVGERLALCQQCADLIDEARAEAAWEAKVS